MCAGKLLGCTYREYMNQVSNELVSAKNLLKTIVPIDKYLKQLQICITKKATKK